MICDSCGLVLAPGNAHELTSEQDFLEAEGGILTRVGTDERRGREYHMATMAHDLLCRAGMSPRRALIYGAGLSKDHAWLRRTWPDVRTYVCDLANLQGAADFVSPDSREVFDVVIASEVVEHFTEVERQFPQMLSKMSEDGLLVFSTNVSDKTPLSGLIYPFIPGHTAYYSGRALILLAQAHDARMCVDFRVPRAALAHLGPRKRYVLMYRNHRIQAAIAEYFAENFTAPSEEPWYPTLAQKLRRWVGRKLDLWQ
jgi:hypothetical protein